MRGQRKWSNKGETKIIRENIKWKSIIDIKFFNMGHDNCILLEDTNLNIE